MRPTGLTFSAKGPQGFSTPLTPMWFPGGEAHIKISETIEDHYQYHLADLRGADPRDLIMLAMWVNAVDARAERKILLLPYLPGARADRGTPFGAAVYAEFFNSMGFDQIITLDPHSEVMPKLLEDSNLTVFPVARIIKLRVQAADSDSRGQRYVGVIAPDKGAVPRAAEAAKVMGVPVYRAEKTRNFETGKLSNPTILDELPGEGRLLIVDDICDGGYTFMQLARVAGLGRDRLDLWVTHGIFSQGLENLTEEFGHIHTTDSWWDWSYKGNPQLTVHPVLPFLTGEIHE